MSVDLDRQLQEYCRLMDDAQVSLSFDDILERSGELPVIPGRLGPQLSLRRRWIGVAAAALAVLIAVIGIRFLLPSEPDPADQPTITTASVTTTTADLTTTTSGPKAFIPHMRLSGYEAGEYWWPPGRAVVLHNPTDESSGVHLSIFESPPAGAGCPVSIDFRCFELAELETVPTVVAGHQGKYFQYVAYNMVDLSGAKRTEVWEIGIEGTKMTIVLSAYSDVTEEELAEGHAIVDSIRTEPWDSEAGFRMIFTIPDGWDSA